MSHEKSEPILFEELRNVYSQSNVHCSVVTDQQNKIVFTSNSFASVLGYEPNELAGKEFYISPNGSVDISLVNDKVAFTKEKSKQGYVMQKNGSLALVDYESLLVIDVNSTEFLLSRISNLEAYQKHHHLITCKQTLENILDNLTVSIVVISPELIVKETNSIFLTTFGLSSTIPDHTLLKNLNCSFWQNENVLFQLKDKYDRQDFDFDLEFDWEKETGETISFKTTSRLIHKNELDELKILLVITDITQEKADQSGRNLQIRHIMHELRNPLSNIALCVELLADSTKENNQEDTELFLTKASNSIQRMKQLINDLNDFKNLPDK